MAVGPAERHPCSSLSVGEAEHAGGRASKHHLWIVWITLCNTPVGPSSRHTAATSLPSASSRSAVVSFRTTCSGLCRFLVVMIIKPSCLQRGNQTLTRRGPTNRGQAIATIPPAEYEINNYSQNPAENVAKRQLRASTRPGTGQVGHSGLRWQTAPQASPAAPRVDRLACLVC